MSGAQGLAACVGGVDLDDSGLVRLLQSGPEGLHSSRNEVARFATRLGLEWSFVLGCLDWKRARFSLLPPPFGPVSIPTSHPPDSIRIDAERGRATGRGWRRAKRGGRGWRHTKVHGRRRTGTESLSSAAFSLVSRRLSLLLPLSAFLGVDLQRPEPVAAVGAGAAADSRSSRCWGLTGWSRLMDRSAGRAAAGRAWSCCGGGVLARSAVQCCADSS